jgi:hypothetical protein
LLTRQTGLSCARRQIPLFAVARTPKGTKIRDFSAEWASMDLVWEGGSLIRLIEPDAWQCIDFEFDAAGSFSGWYVNFQEPVRRTTLGFDTADLVLDLVVAADKTHWLSWRPPPHCTVPALPATWAACRPSYPGSGE